jgi:hypothetical protein
MPKLDGPNERRSYPTQSWNDADGTSVAADLHRNGNALPEGDRPRNDAAGHVGRILRELTLAG